MIVHFPAGLLRKLQALSSYAPAGLAEWGWGAGPRGSSDSCRHCRPRSENPRSAEPRAARDPLASAQLARLQGTSSPVHPPEALRGPDTPGRAAPRRHSRSAGRPRACGRAGEEGVGSASAWARSQGLMQTSYCRAGLILNQGSLGLQAVTLNWPGSQ